jgi:hypothetical protein
LFEDSFRCKLLRVLSVESKMFFMPAKREVNNKIWYYNLFFIQIKYEEKSPIGLLPMLRRVFLDKFRNPISKFDSFD